MIDLLFVWNILIYNDGYYVNLIYKLPLGIKIFGHLGNIICSISVILTAFLMYRHRKHEIIVGDIVATNAIEQWVCSICILIGTCFFAYFVGTLTVLITEGDKIKSYELEKLEEAQSFCEKKKLPKELTRGILTHIRYHCTYNYVFDGMYYIKNAFL